ncbi:hypothetical protein K402DRAFT_341457 [Aulographum hederae CBS 113979]|uniref:Splicing factor Cactin n=1 Tax=Aulographum hederae CBS 113979 TaxID=1176131 RepID=A0A6G1GLV7_9PEZI|nr:hypothetical protein K402DRAFT_341457 [Aulographum hederae CBS 113979]
MDRARPSYGQNPTKRRRTEADAAEDAWVANEDRFALRQAKKRAAIRIRESRAKPIDWLTVTLTVVDPSLIQLLDEEKREGEMDLEAVDPEVVFEDLDEGDLVELEKDIDAFLTIESNKTNVDYWETMKVTCQQRLKLKDLRGPSARGMSAIASDVDRIFEPKSLEELEKLEKQIRTKLRSNEPIDLDYWETLLKSLLVFKARARLRKFSRIVISQKVEDLKTEQERAANGVQEKLGAMLATHLSNSDRLRMEAVSLDPEPNLLQIQPADKRLEISSEQSFLKQLSDERRKVEKRGYIPMEKQKKDQTFSSRGPAVVSGQSKSPGAASNLDASAIAQAWLAREIARGTQEGEEIFTSEEPAAIEYSWSDKYAPRKPRFFNRVQTGYEWNKYNQTHYDHDNPPPKVVQGYKFNIFYPDLLDPSRAPTFKIERAGGRKRGQASSAESEDTCVIRFLAGPPYEDLAFRIVDRDWDYSSKEGRGFKSSFEKGVLQLHFQFKKIYYRK